MGHYNTTFTSKEEKPLFTWTYERPEQSPIIIRGLSEKKTRFMWFLTALTESFRFKSPGLRIEIVN
jgi:hypothetical protein